MLARSNRSSPIRRRIEKTTGCNIFIGSTCRAKFLQEEAPWLSNFFNHESIYIGNDLVVEAIGDKQQIKEAIVKIPFKDLGVELKDLTANMILAVAEPLPTLDGAIYENPLNEEEVFDAYGEQSIDTAIRAKSRIGSTWTYHPIHNNCQHFTHWCRNKQFFSTETQEPKKEEDRTKEEFTTSNGEQTARWKPKL